MQVPEDLLKQLLHPSIQRIEAVVADFGNTVSSSNERVSADLDSALERMQVSSVAVSASVSDLVGKINSMQVPADLLEQRLHPPIQQIETVVADFGNTVFRPQRASIGPRQCARKDASQFGGGVGQRERPCWEDQQYASA